MVVAALVQKYAPAKRDLQQEDRELRAINILTSFASDFDLIGDWLFYVSTRDLPGVPKELRQLQLIFCIFGLFTWLMLASDGRLVRPILKMCNVPSFSTGHLLFIGVVFEDIPQVVLSVMVDSSSTGESGLSTFAMVNLMTAGYDILIKLAEAYDERTDVHNTGAWLMQTFKGHRGWVRSITVIDSNQNGGQFVSGSDDNTAKLWDIKSGKCLMTYEGHQAWVQTVVFDNLDHFLSGSGDHTIKMWEIKTGVCTQTFLGHTDIVRSIALIDDFRFVTGSDDHTCKLWNISSGKCLRTFEGHTNWVQSVANIDGSLFVSGSADYSVKLWDISSGKCIRTFEGHPGWVNTVQSVYGTRFLSGSDDNTIKLWDVSSGKCLCTYYGHVGSVTMISLVDENAFLSSSSDNTIKLWDMQSGNCRRTFIGHSNWVYAVANISGKGEFLSGSADNTIKHWSISVEKKDDDDILDNHHDIFLKNGSLNWSESFDYDDI